MWTFPRRVLLGAASLAFAAAWPAAAGAQVFSSVEIERGLRPGVYVPYEGAPLTQRYAYQTPAFLYSGGSPRELYMLDYLDRLDRAERFGYRPPPNPFRRQVIVYPRHAPPPPPPPVYYYYRR